MKLHDRRRALMGRPEDKILFEWVPADGMDTITIGGTNPNYQLMDDAIRIYTQLSWASTRIRPVSIVSWDGDFTVEVEYKNLTGNKIGCYAMSRSISKLNVKAGVSKESGKFVVTGDSTKNQSITVPMSGKIVLQIDRTAGTGTGILGNVSKTVGIPVELNSTIGFVFIDGNNTTDYVDITHIKVSKGIV